MVDKFRADLLYRKKKHTDLWGTSNLVVQKAGGIPDYFKGSKALISLHWADRILWVKLGFRVLSLQQS